MEQQQVGQILVVVGVAIIVLGVATAAAQAVVKAIREREQDAEQRNVRAAQGLPGLPEGIVKVLIELIKQGGGLAIAAVGVVVLYFGLQLMNDGTEDEAEAPSAAGAAAL